MNEQKISTKVMLIVLDGFGYSEAKEHNAVALAKTPHLNQWFQQYPHSLIEASGEAVGLPPGIMGNSEVGHLSLGSGRIILQDMTRIGRFAEIQGFDSLPAFGQWARATGQLHVLGLLSDGGVHSDISHLFGVIEAIHRMRPGVDVNLHIITDGRDSPPKSAIQFVKRLESHLKSYPHVRIASVVGRFYAMDRDKRWDRIKVAYDGLTTETSPEYLLASDAVTAAYEEGETDEFIKPRRIRNGSRIKGEDSVLFFNFRADRAREISTVLCLSFEEFQTPVKVKSENWVTFVRYQEDFPFAYLFTPQRHKRLLGELVAEKKLTQLRIAETEKYAHVTYFFNGGEEKSFSGEERILVASPKDVATYDLKPEMSVNELTNRLIQRLNETEFALVVLNFANGDMVGHTGNESAAIRAVEAMDKCLGRIVLQAESQKYVVIITADHGNCEEMVDMRSGEPMTQHSINPVQFLLISEELKGVRLKNGSLPDVAPTILDIMGWEKPVEMSGSSLIVRSVE